MDSEQEAKEKIDSWYADDKLAVKNWVAIILFLSFIPFAAYFEDTDDVITRRYIAAYLGFSWALSFLFWGLIHFERGYIKSDRSKRYYRKENPYKFLFLFLFKIILPLLGMLVVGFASVSSVIYLQ